MQTEGHRPRPRPSPPQAASALVAAGGHLSPSLVQFASRRQGRGPRVCCGRSAPSPQISCCSPKAWIQPRGSPRRSRGEGRRAPSSAPRWEAGLRKPPRAKPSREHRLGDVASFRPKSVMTQARGVTGDIRCGRPRQAAKSQSQEYRVSIQRGWILSRRWTINHS